MGSDQQNHITFTPVYHKTTGIGGNDLTDPADWVIAYDYAGTGAFGALPGRLALAGGVA